MKFKEWLKDYSKAWKEVLKIIIFIVTAVLYAVGIVLFVTTVFELIFNDPLTLFTLPIILTIPLGIYMILTTVEIYRVNRR